MRTKDEIQAECLNIIKPLHNCGVGMTMGLGKTLVGLRHMAHNYNKFAKFLVVAPKKAIMKAWEDEARKHKLDYLISHISYSTYLSLTKQDLDYDAVYLDECHSLKNSHEAWLMAYPGIVLGMTGTPPKYNKSEKGKLIDKYCPIVYRYVTDRAVQDEILNDYKIYVHMLQLDKAKTLKVKKNNNTWYTSEQDSYDYWTNRINVAPTQKEAAMMRVMRMRSMMDFPSKERRALFMLAQLAEQSRDKVILFANTQDQADRLCTHSYHSNNNASEDNLLKFKSGEYMALSCVLQLSEGVNIPELKVGIIMHAYGNEKKAAQRIGRLMRLNPKEISIIHVLCYMGTVDELWVKEALDGYDKSKVIWLPSK